METHLKRQESFLRTWEAPSAQTVELIRNPLEIHMPTVANLFRLTLAKLEVGAYFTRSDLKDAILLPAISTLPADFNWAAADPILNLIEEEQQKRSLERPSLTEVERLNQNRTYFRSLRHASGHETRDPESPDLCRAPHISTSATGPILTNIYRHDPSESLPTPIPEKSTYRINLALERSVLPMRVWVDLYTMLCEDPVLAEVGFMSKGRNGYVNDNVIVYCGKEGFQSALKIVGEYCIRENIGKEVPGQAFGVAPLILEGDDTSSAYEGLRVTSNPSPYTFNELQAHALFTAFEQTIRAYGSWSDTLSPWVAKNIRAELDQPSDGFRYTLEAAYEEALKKLGVAPNLRNIAFSR